MSARLTIRATNGLRATVIAAALCGVALDTRAGGGPVRAASPGAANEDAIVVERFSHAGQDQALYPDGTRWHIYQPAGADPADVGAWIRYDVAVPAAIYDGNPVTTYPNLVSAVRGNVCRGARLLWSDAAESVGVTPAEARATAQSGQLVAIEGDSLDFDVPAGLEAGRFRLWVVDPGPPQRSPVRAQQLDESGLALPGQLSDHPTSGATGAAGYFAGFWTNLHPACRALRLTAVNGSGTGECRVVGVDFIQPDQPVEPGTSILIHGQPRCGALMYDGNDGAARVLMPFSLINFVPTGLPTQEFAIYWDTDPQWDGDESEQGPAKSIGGLSHQGCDGGALEISTQTGAGAPLHWNSSFPGDAIGVDFAALRLRGGDAHLRSDRTGGVLGRIEAALLFDASGLRVHNRIEILPGQTAYVFYQYVALPTAPLDVAWVKFHNDDAGKSVNGLDSVTADRRCNGLVLAGGSANVAYHLNQWFGHVRADSPALLPRLARSAGFYKMYITERADSDSPGDAFGPGSVLESGYSLRITDVSRSGLADVPRKIMATPR